MDVCNFIQISTSNKFVDTITGKKFVQIEKEMIEGCLDDELNEMYDPWMANEEDENPVDASECFKLLKPEVYKEFFDNYCERNEIQVVHSKGFTYYFEPKED